MKKSLVIFNWRDPKHTKAGGAEEYLLNYGREFVKNGWRVTWLTSKVKGMGNNDTIDGIRIRRRGGFVTKHILLPLQYIIFENRHCTHIIDSENGIPFFTPLFSRKKIFLLIHHVHQDIFKKHLPFPLKNIACFLEGKIMPLVYKNKKLITVSPSTQKELLGLGFKKENIEIIYNSIDTGKYKPGKKPDYKIFTYLGRITKQKNIETFIDAIPSIKKEFPDAKFVIAGTGPHIDNLRKYSEGINVEYRGFISEEEKIKLLQESYCLIQPSEKEGWGVTIIEANACGTPCVASNVDGLKDSIVEGDTGYLFELDNREDLLSKLILTRNNYTKKLSTIKKHSDRFNTYILYENLEIFMIK